VSLPVVAVDPIIFYYREDDTLSKLSKFTSTILAKKKESTRSGIKEKEALEKKEDEGYYGQVMEDDETEDAGEDWFLGKLKFKKHIDDDYRLGGDGRRVDDYVVIDPKLQDGSGGGGRDRNRDHGRSSSHQHHNKTRDRR